MTEATRLRGIVSNGNAGLASGAGFLLCYDECPLSAKSGHSTNVRVLRGGKWKASYNALLGRITCRTYGCPQQNAADCGKTNKQPSRRVFRSASGRNKQDSGGEQPNDQRKRGSNAQHG
jgi:hypothetical protein